MKNKILKAENKYSHSLTRSLSGEAMSSQTSRHGQRRPSRPPAAQGGPELPPACRARTAGLAARPRRVPGGGGATRPGFGAVSPGHATPAKVRSLRGPPIWPSRPFAIDTGTELGWDWKTCLCRWRGFGLCAPPCALVQALTLARPGFSPATLPELQFLNA